MADQFLQHYKQSFSLPDIDPNMEFMNHFPDISSFNIHGLIGFPHEDNIVLPQLSATMESFPGSFIHDVTADDKDGKRKAVELITPESISTNASAYSPPQVSDNASGKANRGGRGKRPKGHKKDDGKPKEVVHVRAKRGQATDSHSLAERVRRGKINERLRCLQDIVPGCYKAMGMAVMLDEIINYVKSLQNQVEFLSMKLTAASTFHDFNSDTDAMEAMQRAKAVEALKVHQGLQSAHEFPLNPLSFGYFS